MFKRPRAAMSGIAIATLLAGVSTVVGAAPAQAAPERVKIVQHNVEKKLQPILDAVTKAKAIGATGITLQEICQSNVDDLQAATPGSTVNWRPSKVDGCAKNDNVGVAAVWLGGATGDALYPPLTYDTGRTPDLTCVRYGGTIKRFICSVHLVKGDPVMRATQTADIKRLTAKWISNEGSVVVAGDFNAVPTSNEMDSMYALNGNGRFTEGDQTSIARAGDRTSADGRKIDYVFFSQNRTSASQVSGIDVFATSSDHKMLVARAGVNL